MRKAKLELGVLVADRTYDWRRGKSAGSLTVRILGVIARDLLYSAAA